MGLRRTFIPAHRGGLHRGTEYLNVGAEMEGDTSSSWTEGEQHNPLPPGRSSIPSSANSPRLAPPHRERRLTREHAFPRRPELTLQVQAAAHRHEYRTPHSLAPAPLAARPVSGRDSVKKRTSMQSYEREEPRQALIFWSTR